MRLTDKSVYVYFQWHKKLWSVRSRKTGRVLYHAAVVLLYDCEFKVSKAGRKRVLKEKRKNVHAGIAGELDWANNQCHQDDYSLQCRMVGNTPTLLKDIIRPCDIEVYKPASYRTPHGLEAPVPVTYDPYKYESFVRKDNLEPVTRAIFCSMDVHNNDKVLAWHLE
jgi:hypothetical protein